MHLFSGLSTLRAAFSHRNYRIYAAGNAVSLIGTWMQQLAVGWLAWELTHSPAWLGWIVFMDLAPSVLLSPMGGAIADRFDRLKVMVTIDLIGLVLAAVLAALTLGDHMTIHILAALVLINGTVMALRQPVRLAFVPALVPRKDLSGAIAFNSMVFNMARFVGPAVAGVTIASFGAGVAFAVNAVSFLAFVASALSLRLEPKALAVGQVQSSLNPFRSLAVGTRYTVGHVALAPLMGTLLLYCLFARPIGELMPGINAELFLGDARTLGWLTSALGIGAMAGGIWVAGRGGAGHLLAGDVFLGQVLSCLSIIAVLTLDNHYWALPFVALVGTGMVVAGVSTQTAIQLAVEDHMRGRVMSLYAMTFRAAPAIGALVIGNVGEHSGIAIPLGIGAAIALVIALWGWTLRAKVAAALSDDSRVDISA